MLQGLKKKKKKLQISLLNLLSLLLSQKKNVLLFLAEHTQDPHSGSADF